MACLGDLVLEEARKDLGSSSDYGLPGLFCARAVKNWIARASARMAETPEYVGSDGALDTMHQLQGFGWWWPIADLRAAPSTIQPGMLVVWHRGPPDSPHGHIGVVSDGYNGETFGTVEANAAATVSAFRRRLDYGDLLGMGAIPCDGKRAWQPSTPRTPRQTPRTPRTPRSQMTPGRVVEAREAGAGALGFVVVLLLLLRKKPRRR